MIAQQLAFLRVLETVVQSPQLLVVEPFPHTSALCNRNEPYSIFNPRNFYTLLTSAYTMPHNCLLCN